MILRFFSSLLSSEVVLFFTDLKLNASFQRRRLRKSREWVRYNSDDLLSISEWHLKCHAHYFSFRATCVIVKTAFLKIIKSEDTSPIRSDPIRSGVRSHPESDPGFVNGQRKSISPESSLLSCSAIVPGMGKLQNKRGRGFVLQA